MEITPRPRSKDRAAPDDHAASEIWNENGLPTAIGAIHLNRFTYKWIAFDPKPQLFFCIFARVIDPDALADLDLFFFERSIFFKPDVFASQVGSVQFACYAERDG